MEIINCPICGSNKNIFYYKKNNCDLHRCFNCKLVFVWPVPANLQDVYQENYYKGASVNNDTFGYSDYDKDKEPMREIFISYLKKLEKLSPGKKIFDIGCANGYFLDLAKQRGWQTYGVEISGYGANEARKKGHKVFHSPDLSGIDLKFDCITMWDVLEHLESPVEYMQSVNKLLNINGIVAINTIDKSSWWAKFWGTRWNAIVPPEHLLFFSRNNLLLLIKNTKFNILSVQKVGKFFSLSYIFKVLYHWQRLKIYQKLSTYLAKPFWNKFKIPINLRDNILVIAKKDNV